MILFCSTQDLDTSRTRVFLDFLNNSFNYKVLNIQRSSNSIFKIIITFCKLFVKLNPKLIIIGFNSRLFIIPLIFYKKIFNTKVIYDIGYPITDIPDFNILKRKLFNFLDIIAIKNFDMIILESKEQNKLYHKFNIKKLVIFSYIKYVKNVLTSNSNFSNYFLFRGRLNDESGILECIKFFNRYKKHGKSKLIIHGWGKLFDEVKKMIEKSPKNIIFIDRFLDEVEMIDLIVNSKALIGQSKKDCPRLQKTIPHKCFEAVYFEKPYISYLYKPLKEIFHNDYEEKNLQINFNNESFELLFKNLEFLKSSELNKITKKVKNRFELTHKNQLKSLEIYINEFI